MFFICITEQKNLGVSACPLCDFLLCLVALPCSSHKQVSSSCSQSSHLSCGHCVLGFSTGRYIIMSNINKSLYYIAYLDATSVSVL